MPRYYFDVRDSGGDHRDEVGDEFDSLDDARVQAQNLLPDIAWEAFPHKGPHTIVCDVRDETDRIVYRGEITYRETSF